MKDEQLIEVEDYVVLRTTDIADNLDIGESTVRKYCGVLEKKGYNFRRDENGGRVYTDRDQVALLELMKLRKEAKMALDVAADVVATRRRERKTDVAATQVVQPSSEQVLMSEALKIVRDEMRSINDFRNEMTLMKNDTRELLEGVKTIIEDRKQYQEGLQRALEMIDKLDDKLKEETIKNKTLKREIEELKEQSNNSLLARIKKASEVILGKD